MSDVVTSYIAFPDDYASISEAETDASEATVSDSDLFGMLFALLTIWFVIDLLFKGWKIMKRLIRCIKRPGRYQVKNSDPETPVSTTYVTGYCPPTTPEKKSETVVPYVSTPIRGVVQGR